MHDRENLADLRLFFDRYLKDIRNCWESTPRVRVDVMDAYDFDFCKNRPETSFPLKRTEYKKLYLNAADMILNHDLPVETSITKFDSKKGFVNFDIKFTEDVELTGYMKLHLWVSVEDYDNADLFVYVQKLDTKGEFLPTYVLGEPYPGNDGKLRISRRELDLELSTDFQPVQKHTSDQRLKPGEIVPVDVEIYPTSRYWHKGQSLRVQISGHYMREDWFEPFSWDTDNQGSFKMDRQIQHYAVRFAGKEAVYKAISFCGVDFRPSEIEIISDENERPFVQIHGKTKESFEKQVGQKYQIHISLSYENENAIAFAVAESTGGKRDEYHGTDL